MGFILKHLSGAAGPYILIAAAVALLGLFITTKVLWSANGELRDDLATARATIDTVTSANVANQGAISTLKAANASWVALFKGQGERDAAAVAEAAAFQTRLDALNKALYAALRQERQEPDCANLMQMDIQRVCPVTAQQLRDLATGGTH